MSTAIVWFRNDLRLSGNPAWAAATAECERIVPLFVVDARLWDAAGEHRRNQLAAHLGALDGALAEAGGRLLVRRGESAAVVVAEAQARRAAVYWNNDVTPFALERDRRVAGQLGDAARRLEGRWVHAPGLIVTDDGGAYRVFTPFYRKWKATAWDGWPYEGGGGRPTAEPGDGVPAAGPPLMEPGEAAARGRLERFLDGVDGYDDRRDRPDLAATSRLSADLKYGTISAREVVVRVGGSSPGRSSLVRQLAWRDFYAQVMAAMPWTARGAMRPEYDTIRWRTDPEGLAAWAEGRTGYPIVDAAMRQLRSEGWIHNRARMVAASFLVKDLLIDWRLGERHFRRWLVDGDVAQNVGNWQWVAGTGADAAPYFRVFNPVGQGRRFDPEGEFVRRWVPELAGLSDDRIHAPWEADPEECEAAGVVLGDTYPAPIVDHAEARRSTLAAYRAARESGG